MSKLTGLAKLTEILSDLSFHDGTHLGQSLGVSRAAIWKMIKKLESYEVDVHSVKGKGYQLAEPLIMLASEKINFPDVVILEKIDSTNTYVKEHAHQQAKPLICIAEMQTAGKGRLGRQWHSPFGKNVYLSMGYTFDKDISELSGLSLVIGLAVCQVINRLYELPTAAKVKWPNDILIGQEKLSGILVEIQAESHGKCQVTLGMGINVNMMAGLAIDASWTSIQKLTGQYQDRNILVTKLLDQLIKTLSQFQHKGLLGFIDQWNKNDALMSQHLRLEVNGVQFEGDGMGITPHGHLKVKLKDGQEKCFASGEAQILRC